MLHALDLAAVVAAFVIALLSAPGAIGENPVAWGILARYAGWVAGLGFVWLVMAHSFRAYEGEIRASVPATVRQLSKAGLVAGGLFLAVGVGPGGLALENPASTCRRIWRRPWARWTWRSFP